MSTFHLTIRLNVPPAVAGPVIDALAPLVKEAGLSFRSGVPGLIDGRGLTADQLAILLNRLSDLAFVSDTAAAGVAAGVFDDVWVHLSRER